MTNAGWSEKVLRVKLNAMLFVGVQRGLVEERGRKLINLARGTKTGGGRAGASPSCDLRRAELRVSTFLQTLFLQTARQSGYQ